MIINDFLEGHSLTAYEYFGAHFVDGGVRFATYAPNARNVTLMLNGGEYEMNRLDSGVWETVRPAENGDIYQFIITTQALQKHYRSDPFAFYSEVRPKNASIIYDLNCHDWHDGEWMSKRDKCYDKPMNIYEIHFGSWRTKFDSENDDRFYTYDEMADILIPYVKDMGYTHIEIMPLTEHPYDGSWGYQVTGYYSATSRYGDPAGLMRFIDACHQADIGVILDFVPVHFVTDFFALHIYDGGFLFESDREEERFSEWGTALFDYSKPHVLSFVKSSINFWIEKYHVDGLRYDAVANLIFKHGRRDEPLNDTGIWFLKNTNYAIQKRHPDVILFAEDSTDQTKVTAPVEFGGLGFDYKWDLGFMHDTINYIKTPPYERRAHHSKMTFSMSYFYNDLFILPYSHDEVVHGKKTMLDKCFGTHEEKIATIKCLYTFQFGHPGKKLNFMGNEIAEYMEWRPEKELGWNLLTYPAHDSVHHYIKELHHIYLNEPALYENDYNAGHFRWCDANNSNQSIYAFIRRDNYGKGIYFVFNFSGLMQNYILRVEQNGDYSEILNSDKDIYAGTNCLNGDMRASNYSLNLRLAPLSCAIIKQK
ncbi:1,4-alpha-glucan branching protein [Ruminococcus albus SY3]|uniref:1,4-alpha-glucan branching enzyme n=1 Tax=Ruminococcus albus SY3 TaxID=1341156 RepID=A0A011UXN8_RUMAL|nr:1,4-alpha-glucan branching protein GlgB [Ruminococcus albus]EXM37967.1 1,4-alpha-glucan branching protein [Ruminococcus albus SY3]